MLCQKCGYYYIIILVIFDHHIVRISQICSLNKLTSKELYLILVNANTVKPAAQDYFKNLKIISRIFLKHPSLTGKKSIS